MSLLLAFASCLPLVPVPQDAAGSGPLERRAHEVAALVKKAPEWPDELFDTSFVKLVPRPKMAAILEQYFGMIGAVADVQPTERTGEFSGKFDLVGDNDQIVELTLFVASKAPHPIVGLYFGNPAPMTKDLGAVAAEIAKLPGKKSFGVWKLGGKDIEALAVLEPDLPLALGSAFKLYVLGALVQDVADGKRKPEDVVRLEQRWTSLSSGQMQKWAAGSPVTLSTLASMMISISDNTATDHLLFTLGRERVEAMLSAMGNTHAERNVPFLSTGEMFRLKLTAGGKGADDYPRLDTKARRELLAKIGALPLDETSVDMSLFAAPTHVDDVEWFASASDLARAMDWLRRETEPAKTQMLRGALSINPGLSVSKESFPFVGYKGGSEPGVLNLTFVLRSKDGTWYAASAGWNDPTDALDEKRLMGLMQRALYLLGKGAR